MARKKAAKLPESIVGIISGAAFNNAITIALAREDGDEIDLDEVRETAAQLVESAVEFQVEMVAEYGDPKAGGNSSSRGRSGTSGKGGSTSRRSKGSGNKAKSKANELSRKQVKFYGDLVDAIEEEGGDPDDLTYASADDFADAVEAGDLTWDEVQEVFDEAKEMRDDLQD
jgi:hypothetical protein